MVGQSFQILRLHAKSYRFKCDIIWLFKNNTSSVCRVQLKYDGTRWRTGREVKEKLANGVGRQYSSRYLGTWCIQHYYRRCAHLGCQYSTEMTPPANLNGLVRFAERRNLVSARLLSHFKRSLPNTGILQYSFMKTEPNCIRRRGEMKTVST
jgi:hypothetical protein